jgi:metallo-beta-lactamase family protein
MRSTRSRLYNRATKCVAICVAVMWLLAGCSAKPAFEYVGYGANRCVSGALHVIRAGTDSVIFDVGSFYGNDGDGVPPIPEETVREASAIIISHAHADHIGRLTYLYKIGYRGPIYCTEPTRELMKVMLPMSARFSDMGRETFYYSANSLEKNQKVGKNTQVHLYTCEWGSKISPRNMRTVECARTDLEELGFYLCKDCAQQECDAVMTHVQTMALGVPFRVSGRLEATFYNTPHLPGSAMVRIVDSRSGKSLLYTGDFGSGLSPYLPRQSMVPSSNVAIVEATYGAQDLVRSPDERDEFRRFIGDCIRDGKRVIIPAFVLDRTQQVLGEITTGMREGTIPRSTKVKVFSPSALQLNEIYAQEFTKPRYSEFFTESFMRTGPFEQIYEAGDGRDVLPGEIGICSSGTADHAYSKEFVKRWVEDANTVFVFVGYQDPETIGGKLTSFKRRNNEQIIYIDGTEYTVKAQIWQTRCFSGHASYEQILSFLTGMPDLRTLVLVHLEEACVEQMIEKYTADLSNVEVICPESGVVHQLGRSYVSVK